MVKAEHTNPLGPEAVIVAPVTGGSGQPWYWGRGLEAVFVDEFKRKRAAQALSTLQPFSKWMNLSEQGALSFQRLATKELIAEC